MKKSLLPITTFAKIDIKRMFRDKVAILVVRVRDSVNAFSAARRLVYASWLYCDMPVRREIPSRIGR